MQSACDKLSFGGNSLDERQPRPPPFFIFMICINIGKLRVVDNLLIFSIILPEFLGRSTSQVLVLVRSSSN